MSASPDSVFEPSAVEIDPAAKAAKAQAVYAERVRMAYLNSQPSLFLAMAAIVIVTAFLWKQADTTKLLIWTSAIGLVYLLRWCFYLWHEAGLAKRSARAERTWSLALYLQLGVAGAVWSGLYWGVTAPIGADFGFSGALVLIAVAAAALRGLASLPLSYALFIAAMLLPVAVPSLAAGDSGSIALGLTLLAFLLSMLVLARSGYREFRQRLSLQREMTALLASRDRAKQAAEAANHAKSQFLANMSHEIRTPMNAVLGLAQLALNHEKEPKQRERLRLIDGAGQSLLRIINDILDLTKIEAGKLEIVPVKFDVRALLSDVTTLAAFQAHEKGLAFACEIDPLIPERLVGDPVRIGQVLTNLCGNAIKFTERGQVQLTVTGQPVVDPGGQRRTTLAFTVRDSGIGLSALEMARLFQPFSQIDSLATRKHKGTGLGLSISRHLVGLMGGRISVDSQPSLGSEFRFTVVCGLIQSKPKPKPKVNKPVSGQRSGQAENIESVPPETMPARLLPARSRLKVTDLRGSRILLVEDDVVNQMVALGLLETTGATVTTANNGREAVTLVRPGLFDLVLMDLQMPELDGIDATRELRRNPALASLPIIAMTASAMAGDRERFLAAGMNDYIAKPVSLRELHAKLGHWLGSVEEESADTIDPRL